MKSEDIWRPEIITLDSEAGKARLVELQHGNGTRVVDTKNAMLTELAAILSPVEYFAGAGSTLLTELADDRKSKSVPDVWAWYPWKKTLVSILPEEDFVRIRTSRNKYLISEEEQTKFRDLRIGIAGLSVGYSIALAIVLEGGGKNLHLADYDTLDLSNLNRLPYSIDEIGLKKSTIVARRLYELDPYLNITLFSSPLTKENISKFTNELGVIIDEVDNFAIKLLLRQQAMRLHIPVLMATDNEETGLIDVERYDTEENVRPFLSRIPESTVEALSELTKQEAGKLIAQYVGGEFTSERMRESLQAMGTKLVSWPQIGGTAMLNGGAVAYAIRTLITHGAKLRSGRYSISLPNIFGIS